MQQAIEHNLQTVKKGILSDKHTDKTIAAINNFQNDPALLTPHLPTFIKSINNTFIRALNNNNNTTLPTTQAILFYNLAKICSVKTVINHLSTDISHLDPITRLLSSTQPWEIHYFLLAWTLIIIQSPFNITNDTLLYNTTNNLLKNQVLYPLITNIHASLYHKNYTLFLSNYDSIDLITLNKFLKTQLIESTSNVLSDIKTLNNITSSCLSCPSPSPSQIVVLKILPKLFLLHSWNQDWNSVSNIVQWYDSHLDSDFNEVRFALAHSYSKILSHMINRFQGSMQATQCIECIINDLLHLTKNNPIDIIDFNTFHTYLLLIAECSNHIIQLTPHFISIITNDILPLAYLFQQLYMNNIIRGSQVKDAANFIIWAWSKSNHASLSNSTIYDLIKFLLITSLFDTDFLIRKSANAALQELLGRHGHRIFNNITTMQLIQLPIHNLHKSFHNNLTNLYNILSPHHNQLFKFIINWFLTNNIMQNLDLNTVMLSINALYQLHSRIPNFQLLPLIDNFLSINNKKLTTTDPHTATRFVFLLIKLSHTDNPTPLINHLNNLASFIQINKIKANLNLNDYFNCLTNLNYCHFKLVQNNDNNNTRIILHKIDLFYNIISKISQDNLWFDQFKLTINQIIHILDQSSIEIAKETVDDLDQSSITIANNTVNNSNQSSIKIANHTVNNSNQSSTTTISDAVNNLDQPSQKANETSLLLTEFWDKFENLIKCNNPLIVSSLPMLSPPKFSKFYNHYKFILTCQSKSLIISTFITNNDSFMKLRFANDDDGDVNNYINLIIEWLNDHTITEQGDVGRLTREAACQLVLKYYRQFDINDIKQKLIPTLLYLAIEPSQKVRKLCFNILTEKSLSDHLPKSFSLKNDNKMSHTIFLLNLQLTFDNDNISRTFFRHFFTSAGALHTTEEELMTAIDNFIKWYDDLDEITQRNTLNNIIIAIPSYQDIKTDKSLMKYTICGLKFLERIWCSRCACGYSGFNWNGIFAKFYNITLLKNKQLLGAILQVIPTLAIAWKESSEIIEDYNFINKLIQFLVKLINTNNNGDTLKYELTPIQRNGIESLVALLLEFEEIEKVAHINTFIETYQLNSLLQTSQLLL